MPPTGKRTPFALNASVLVALLAASSAPTPLYPVYQDRWGLSALSVTVVFSAYTLALLAALLTTGALSDHLGRRPVLVGSLALEAVAMAALASADGAGTLIAARVLQGLATGAATSAAGAALVDLDPPGRPGRSALTNSIAPAAGMAAGVLAATLLIRYAPGPTVTVYLALALVFVLQAAAIAAFAPETTRPHAGAWRSLRPRAAVPPPARRAFLISGAGVVAVWALGGFYSSLGPAFVRLVAPGAPQAAGGMVFFTLSLSAAVTVWTTRALRPLTATLLGCAAVPAAVALSLTGMHLVSLPAVFAAALLAGVAFGAVAQGSMRMVLARVPEPDRSTTLAAYYVLSYAAMSLPAVGAGVLTQPYGLRTAAHLYAALVALLATAALLTLTLTGTRRRSTGRAAGSGGRRVRSGGRWWVPCGVVTPWSHGSKQ
ncbi:MFS transporter [Streptomyces erythrochromogenes]|uniref:MFS transporter n=1 Tax=Streptomyces erythrochromogenes TaxID=285574 RepID=UPI0038678B4A|nr:MFS transporter [Streptomyces erythrochromogenes]